MEKIIHQSDNSVTVFHLKFIPFIGLIDLPEGFYNKSYGYTANRAVYKSIWTRLSRPEAERVLHEFMDKFNSKRCKRKLMLTDEAAEYEK